jgi:hypothetical protein
MSYIRTTTYNYVDLPIFIKGSLLIKFISLLVISFPSGNQIRYFSERNKERYRWLLKLSYCLERQKSF